jgi:hypothetical protein
VIVPLDITPKFAARVAQATQSGDRHARGVIPRTDPGVAATGPPA